MMYFINTRDPDYKAINQYMLNLGVVRPRRNPDDPAPPSRQRIQRDPFAHKLMNMMLRQAVALGWGSRIDLQATNITPGSPQHWGRLPKPLQLLSLDEIIKLLKMQIRLLGRVAPTAICWLKDVGGDKKKEIEKKIETLEKRTKPDSDSQAELDRLKQSPYLIGQKIPMIVDWHYNEKARRGELHWKPPLLRLEDQPTEDSTYIVFDYDGNQVEVETIMKGEQLIAGGEKIKRPVPRCYDAEGRHFRPFEVNDVSRWYTVYPLPFIPASWARGVHANERKKSLIRLFGTAVVANEDDSSFEIIEGGAGVISPEATFDVTPCINSVYDTPTKQRPLIKELDLDYPGQPPVIGKLETDEEYQKRRERWEKNKDDKYQWQGLALARFEKSGFSGMVEACTGSGKTIFCAQAIKAVIQSEIEVWGQEKPDLCISIVVPTVALLKQWYDFLRNDDHGLKRELESGLLDGISIQGGGSKAPLSQVNLFVVNTAAAILTTIRSEEELLTLHEGGEAEEKVIFAETTKAPDEESPEDMLPKHLTLANIKEFTEKYKSHFLIVDEAHRTTSDTFRLIYEAPRDHILLVSATFPTNKERYEVLDAQTEGRMLCFYRYPHALKKGNISDFNLHYVRVRLSSEETRIYDHISALIKHFSTQHSSEIGSTEEQTRQLIQDLDKGVFKFIEKDKRIQRSLGIKIVGGKAKAIRKDPYSVFMMKVLGGARARLSWASGNRLACALSLIEQKLADGKTIIVFHKSVDGAAALYKLLYNRGWGSGPGGRDLIGIYHSQLLPSVNAAYLKAFKDKKIRCLISVQALLEGLDVPHCDVGIAVAADQSDIKLVQSLGRVLRVDPGSPKKDYYFLSGILGEVTVEDQIRRTASALEEARDRRVGKDPSWQEEEYEKELEQLKTKGTIGLRGTKDLVVEAKFGNTLKDSSGLWIIDPPTTKMCPSLDPEDVKALKKEAGLPTAVKLESFIEDLMKNDDNNPDKNWEIDEDTPSLEDDIKTRDDESKQRVHITHPSWVSGRMRPLRTRSGIIRGTKDPLLDVEGLFEDPITDAEAEEAREALGELEEGLPGESTW